MTETTEKKTLSLGGARKTTKVSATTAGGKTKAVEVKEKKPKIDAKALQAKAEQEAKLAAEKAKAEKAAAEKAAAEAKAKAEAEKQAAEAAKQAEAAKKPAAPVMPNSKPKAAAPKAEQPKQEKAVDPEKEAKKKEEAELRRKQEELARQKAEMEAKRAAENARRLAEIEREEAVDNNDDFEDERFTSSYARDAERDNDRRSEGNRNRGKGGVAKAKKGGREDDKNERNADRRNQKDMKGKGKNGKKGAALQQAFTKPVQVVKADVVIGETITVADLANKMAVKATEIIKLMMKMGEMVTINQVIDQETAQLVAEELGHKVILRKENELEEAVLEDRDVDAEKVTRAPVVTIMGHVDHGKTTLLDTLRNSRVATGEAGGITQHIGAYQIEEGGKKITFLDTPGHAAFTSMRARGASVTDITILIVAADDGVMPQTIEAINHSKAAGVPIIVAINKIDKPGANPERVIGELAEHGVISTAWGGDSEFVEISAKFGQNIEELLETVLLVAEVEELKADPTVRAIGTVIEARLDKGKGAVATLLVQQGTLNVQDPIVVGNTFGRVRAMTNDLGRRIKTAAPSTPVSITGLNEAPMAGDHFAVYEDEKAARAAGEERAKRALMKQRQQTHRVSLDNLFDTLKAGEMKTVNVIIKADVQGSVEALAASLLKIDVEGVRVNVVHSAVGAINESDITLAEASDAVVIGFNVRPTPQARQQAETDEVEIRLHSIIYKVIEEIEDAMKGMLDPEFEEKIIGEAVIRETFKVSKVGTIGGFMVTNGKITRDSSARVIRDGVVIFDGKLASLKHYKDDVKEVGNAQEGGLMIENYNDIKVDDVIEAYIMEEIKR